jgi:capsular polysaccharide transport system permease protein
MAESPIRLPTPASREIARADGERGALVESAPARPAFYPVAAPRASGRIAGWARRVGIVKLLWFFLAVVLPGAAAAIYYFGIAADQYVSEFFCVVRPVEDSGNTAVGSFMASAAGSQTALQSNVVVQYIKSAEIVRLLEQQIGLRKRFSGAGTDFWARLDPAATQEELVAYWNRKVEPFYDMTTGTVSVRVTAFSPQDAQLIARHVIELSTALVNDMSENARRDAVRLDEDEADRAGQRLHQIRQKILDFRNTEQMIDPKKEADSNLALVSKLRENLALAQADLNTYGAAKEAPGAKLLQNRIAALQQQIAAASAPVTGAGGTAPKALSSSVGSFEDLDSQRQIAERYYDSTLSALEKAKYDADRTMTYFAVFVEPNLPQSSTYPRRATSVALTLLAGFGAWIFGIVIAHSVREHV